MIQLSNGHAFEYMAASGALAYDGRGWPWEWPLRWVGLLDPRLFTSVTKTLTPEPRRGNLRWSHPWSVVAGIPNGAVNAIGLTNPGIEWWVKTVAPQIPRRGYNIVCSITADEPQTISAMAARLDDTKIRAIELNASCPNTDVVLIQPHSGGEGEAMTESGYPPKVGGRGNTRRREPEGTRAPITDLLGNAALVLEMVRGISKASRHPLILKLSVQHDYIAIARACEGLVEAIAINSVPWSVAFPGEPSPLARFGGGGVSGRAAQPWTWKMVREFAGATNIPVIGPGVWDYSDLARLRELGAKAVSFGSIFMRTPWRPTHYIRREQSLRNITPITRPSSPSR